MRGIIRFDPMSRLLFETPEAGSGGETQGDGAAEGAGAQPDFSPVLERMDQFGERLGQIEGFFTEDDDGEYDDEPGQPQQPAAGQPMFDPYTGQPIVPQQTEEQQAVAALQQYISDQVQQGVQQGLAPVQETQQDFIDQQQTAALEERYPELQDREVAEALVDRAAEIADAMGMDERAALNPQFLALVHQADVRAQQAAGETPAGQSNGAQLEGGGGASPPTGEQPDEGDLILNAGPKRSFLTGSEF